MRNKKRSVLTIGQVLNVILSIIAIAYIMGSATPVVSAAGQCTVTGVPVESITNVNAWCLSNGGSQVCNGGSGAWSLKEVDCPTEAANSPTTPNPTSIASTATGARDVSEAINNFNNGGSGNSAACNECLENEDSATCAAVCGTDGGNAGNAIGAASGLKGLWQKEVLGVKGLSVGYILKTAGYAAAIYYGSKWLLGNVLGGHPELANSISTGLTAGYIAYSITNQFFAGSVNLPFLGATSATGVGAIVFVAVFILSGGLSKHRVDLYQFSCYPWDAPLGGNDCEQCNGGEFPCTEYRCRSLGQACELQNKGTNEELCVWANRNDARAPVISAWDDTLSDGYKYLVEGTGTERGVRIVPTNDNNGCIEANKALRFGITLDEPGKCSLDTSNVADIEEMRWAFGGSSTTKYNHSQTMSLPSVAALESENATLENGGEFSLYTRCQDANGNANTANFVFKFCVDKGPDTTAPQIVSTSILNGYPVSFGTTSVNLQAYVDELAECRWSKTDQSYESMENQMSCSSSVSSINAQGLYTCSTTLNGLNDAVDNDFYFRCKDQPYLETSTPTQRNANSQSYKFTLVGTRSLAITSVEPNGTVSDSTDLIKVTLKATTNAGYREGAALCEYRGFGTNGQFNDFLITGTHQHSQELFLAEGTYSYDIKCTDLGGNSDTKTVNFNVESDSDAPIAVRVYREENLLKIITNEEATCVYNDKPQLACNYLYKDGTPMTSLENNKHQVAWNPDKTYYIKCQDEFGNQPEQADECSIIARPFGK